MDEDSSSRTRAGVLEVTHLSDGRAELALQHFLQGLELVTGNVPRLLQLLQQLDGPGNIWRKRGDLLIQPHQPVAKSMGGIMEIDGGEKDRTVNHQWERSLRHDLHDNKGWWE